MKTEHPFYGFTAERHSEADAQIDHLQSDLRALLAEYRGVCADTNRHGHTALTMEAAVNALQQVRLALQMEQNNYRRRV